MSFTGVESAFGPIRAAAAALEQEACTRARIDVMSLLQMLIDITPVNTGETVRNFAVSVAGRASGLKPPLGQQPPGPTNLLPIGDEPNRAQNEAAAIQDATASLSSYRKLAPLVVSNAVAQWGLIESGQAPGAPWKNRGAGGHTGLAQAYLRSTGNWK